MCVDDGNVYTCLFRLLQGAPKAGGLGIDDNRRISLAAITPVARGRLRIEINDFCAALSEEKELDTSQIDDVMTVIAKKEG